MPPDILRHTGEPHRATADREPERIPADILRHTGEPHRATADREPDGVNRYSRTRSGTLWKRTAGENRTA
jgi:hypothetical protein